MSDERQQQIGAVYIPAPIMCEETITMTQKVIWGRIQGLSVKEGYCYASNKWIGEQIGLSKGTISNNISVLVAMGYLAREIIRNDNNEIKERRLYPISPHLSLKKVIPVNDKIDTPINAIVEGSVTGSSVTEESKKTRSDKPTASRKQVKYDATWYKEVLDAYQEIRGIALNGPEFSPLQQTIKTIFMAGHEPKDAIGLMHALEDSDEEWTCNWTLRTVKMKLPLWKAGKLTLQDEQARIREYDRKILAGESV